jgi:hypothetical protein
VIDADNLGVDPAVARMRRTRKPRGGTRAICELEPGLATAYRTAVARIAPTLENLLSPAVRANRARSSGSSLILGKVERARRGFEADLRTASEQHRGPLLVADVLDCYASISLRAVLDSIPAEAPEVASVLSRFREGGVRGLPVGPAGSAVLANAVLSALDDVVSGAGVRHLRWVDDLYIFTDSSREARVILDRLRKEADRLGWSLNEEKSGAVDVDVSPQPRRSGGVLGPLA